MYPFLPNFRRLISFALPFMLWASFTFGNSAIFKAGTQSENKESILYANLKGPIPTDPNSLPQTTKPRPQNVRKGARFLRIEIPDDNRILTLNEVKIISGGKNIANQGKATQSSVAFGGVPSRAIDGINDPDYNIGGQTHTDGAGSINPWWEVDLGKEFIVDEVEVWNRKGFESRRTC